MQPRNFVFITVITLCHLQLAGQMLTNALPPVQSPATLASSGQPSAVSQLPDDPGQEAIPIAKPEPVPATGVPVELQADRQTWAEDTWTGTVIRVNIIQTIISFQFNS